MISEVQQEDILINLNPEVNEYIEKLWTKSAASTKEQKEKNMNELFYLFLKTLNTHLNEFNTAEITDLIFDKSIVISETIGNYDWPNAETLKVSNLHRLALFFYFYAKSSIGLFHPKAKKQNKEAPLKACENLLQMLNVLIELPLISKLQPNCLHLIFEDLFTFYSMVTHRSQALKDEIEGTISLYNEETNIASLARLKSIDKTAESNFYLGTLVTLFSYKINMMEGIRDKAVLAKHQSDLEAILSHFDLLNQFSHLTASEIALFSALNELIDYKSTKESFKRISGLFIKGKKYLAFLNHSKLYDIVNYSQNLLRVLIVIVLVENKMKISSLILEYLNYDKADVFGLLNANCENLLPIKRMLKGKENGFYKTLKFSERIVDRLSKGGIKGELTYQMLFKDCKGDEKKPSVEAMTEEGYLGQIIKGRSKPYGELLKELETIK